MSNVQDYKFDDRCFKSIIAKSKVANHKFFELIQEETNQTKILLRQFLQADYLVAKGFRQFLAYLVSLVDDLETRMLLIGNRHYSSVLSSILLLEDVLSACSQKNR
jgi:pyrroloquinoline quinone (PQQ) biosynthesis protein C